MTTPLVDPDSVAVVGTGGVVPSTWCQTVAANIQTLSRMPGCVVRRSTTQSIGNNSLTAVQFSAADLRDTDNYHNTVTNNSRMTVPTGLGGWYQVTATISWATNATGRRIIAWRINGSTTGIGIVVPASPSGGTGCNLVDEIELAAGDYVEVLGLQQSGANLDISEAKCALRLVALS